MENRSNIRNIAIIAHVDHGKTTLVDQLLTQSGTLQDVADRVMDSDALEKERGITILAKQTGIRYSPSTGSQPSHEASAGTAGRAAVINIVDTPGHTDFGGEVERTLQMVEGFLLLVDAAEGVLPGTRFVLKKALELKLKPIVVINKIDRKDADTANVESAVQDLFLELATEDSQLDFPVLYGSGKLGFAGYDQNATSGDMKPLLDAIVEHIPAPQPKGDNLQILVTNLTHSDFLGTIAIGRVFSGSLRVGDQFVLCKDDTVSRPMKATKLYNFLGLDRHETDEIGYGDIVALAGFTQPVSIGTTICSPDHVDPYPYVSIDEPTLSLFVSVNDSPFNGRDGKLLTSRQIKERLQKELKTNVALRVEETDSPETFKVSGRGQLHLGILVENMRREGFEMQLSAPEVIYKTIDGKKHEPIEHVIIDVDQSYQGVVMERLGTKKAQMKDMQLYDDGRVRLEFEVPSRGLMGFKSQFLTDTRGTGLLNFQFAGYQSYKGDIPVRTKGALVSMENGAVAGYALDNLQSRGILFVKPTDKVYEGMIVGEHSRENDLVVNPCKTKKLTNMRASGTDGAIQLAPPRPLELEQCMEWIRPDELIEVTPGAIRLRKKILKEAFRKKR